jgi:hypothetical protein
MPPTWIFLWKRSRLVWRSFTARFKFPDFLLSRQKAERFSLSAELSCREHQTNERTGKHGSYPVTGTGRHQAFSSYVYTHKQLIKQAIQGTDAHHLAICTHCE